MGSYVAVVYEQSWWIGVVIDVNDEEKDVEVKFMHPKGPARYFNWPERDDYCYIPNDNVLTFPQAHSSTGRNYEFEKTDIKDIENQWNLYSHDLTAALNVTS